MSKFTNHRKELGEIKAVKTIRIYEGEVKAVKQIHDNFSEFARAAILEKIDRMKNGKL